MAVSFKKAKREQLWTKILLTGPSGSGKTYSSLRLATGLAEASNSRIAYIDTENGRARYYADEFDFDDIQLTSPFSSTKYIEAIDSAINSGYKVIVIDSLSHEWLWCNDQVNNMQGNSFQNWGKVKTKWHNPFMEFIIQSPIHIIATARGKDKWVLEEKNGKQTPTKKGEGSIQSDDTEYNYTITFNLNQDTHVASCSKDNTHLFEDRYDVLTEKDGALIYEWANKGEKPAKKEVIIPHVDDIDLVINEIREEINKKINAGTERDTIAAALKTSCGTAQYGKIKDIEKAKAALKAVREV